ncbi:unnamed protein product [Schistosoma turkestanicum]|nr:unnamed protein product [Schistosoma turkestanicum]
MGPCSPELSQAFIWIYTVDEKSRIGYKLWSSTNVVLNSVGTDHFLSESLNYLSYEDPEPWPSKNVGKLIYKAIEISADIYNITNFNIIGTSLFIPITCGLQQNDEKFSMNVAGLIWNEFLSQTPITDLFIQSGLTIKQTQSIKLHGMDPVEKENYMRPALNMNTVRYNSLISDLNNAMYDMIDRNLTIHLGKVNHFVSKSKQYAQLSQSFHITLLINLPKQELLFETSFIHRLKWAYIFYICLWIIFYWPIQWLQRWALEQRQLWICYNLVEFKQPPAHVYLNQLKNEW